MISPSTGMASARSILATSAARPPASLSRRRAWCMSSAERTKDTARKSAPISAASWMSALSLSDSASTESPPPCRLSPLRLDSLPATSTSQRTSLPTTSRTVSATSPSSSNSTSPALTSSGKP